MDQQIRLGDYVRVKIAKPDQWSDHAAKAMNGHYGTIEVLRSPIQATPTDDLIALVRFTAPIAPWNANQAPVEGFHFDLADLVLASRDEAEGFDEGFAEARDEQWSSAVLKRYLDAAGDFGGTKPELIAFDRGHREGLAAGVEEWGWRMSIAARMDKARIKRALSHVHATEQRSENPEGYPRVRAARLAISLHRLNADEVEVLLRALNIEPEELRR